MSSYLFVQAVHGILMWNMNIVDEETIAPNKAGQEYLRLTKYYLKTERVIFFQLSYT